MLSISANRNSHSRITIAGFEIDLFGNQNYITGKPEVGLCARPSLPFHADMLTGDYFHFIFNVDNSGSMGSMIGKQIKYNSNMTRITIVKSAIIEILRFLHALAVQGKTVYLTVVLFNSSASVLFEHICIPSVEEELTKMIKTLDKIQTYGSTDIGASIDEIKRIEDMYSEDTSFKILLSDGYVNFGLQSVELKNIYSNFFDTTIGIGKETEYDKDLLITISKEASERSCDDALEMKEQIIDSVFGNISFIAEAAHLGSTDNILSVIETDNCTKDTHCVYNNLRITTNIFATLKYTSPYTLQLLGVSENYLMTAGFMGSNITSEIYSSIVHCQFGMVSVKYEPSKQPVDTPSVDITVDISPNQHFLSNPGSKEYRIIQTFIEISNTFNELDFSTIETQSPTLIGLNNKIDALLKSIDKSSCQSLKDYITPVLNKFKVSLEPLVYVLNSYPEGFCPPALMRNLSTSVRMCSSQSAGGSFAFMGRQVSSQYSQACNSLDQELSPSDTDHEAGISIVNTPATPPPTPVTSTTTSPTTEAPELLNTAPAPPPPLPIPSLYPGAHMNCAHNGFNPQLPILFPVIVQPPLIPTPTIVTPVSPTEEVSTLSS